MRHTARLKRSMNFQRGKLTRVFFWAKLAVDRNPRVHDERLSPVTKLVVGVEYNHDCIDLGVLSVIIPNCALRSKLPSAAVVQWFHGG